MLIFKDFCWWHLYFKLKILPILFLEWFNADVDFMLRDVWLVDSKFHWTVPPSAFPVHSQTLINVKVHRCRTSLLLFWLMWLFPFLVIFLQGCHSSCFQFAWVFNIYMNIPLVLLIFLFDPENWVGYCFPSFWLYCRSQVYLLYGVCNMKILYYMMLWSLISFPHISSLCLPLNSVADGACFWNLTVKSLFLFHLTCLYFEVGIFKKKNKSDRG